jgi:hypothetical protein
VGAIFAYNLICQFFKRVEQSIAYTFGIVVLLTGRLLRRSQVEHRIPLTIIVSDMQEWLFLVEPVLHLSHRILDT